MHLEASSNLFVRKESSRQNKLKTIVPYLCGSIRIIGKSRSFDKRIFLFVNKQHAVTVYAYINL